MSDPTFQMLWRCEQCKTGGLLALTQRYCPQCGTAQDAANRYFPEEGQEVAVENHRYVGADWPCAYCEAPNSAASAFCTHCGGPREGKTEVARIQDTPSGEVNAKANLGGEPAAAATASAPGSLPFGAAATDVDVRSTGHARPFLAKTGVAFGLVIFALVAYLLVSGANGLFSLFTKHDEIANVVDQQWSRSVKVEHFSALTESNWCDSMPSDAYNVSKSRAQRGTREVEDGQVCNTVREDKGDGTFTKRRECETRWRSEPVYDNRCRYQVNRWSLLRTEALSGDSLAPPTWPVPQLAAVQVTGAGEGGQPMTPVPDIPGAQRLGTRMERYEVKLRNDAGKEWTCSLPEARWAAMRPDTRVTFKARTITGADCDSLVLVQ